jgi:anti-sigma B factor antagonist
MEINVKASDQVAIVEISGDIDSKTTQQVQEQLMDVLQYAREVILDVHGVRYMSSAGLRLMLIIHRQLSSDQGSLILVGLSEEIKETMSATGFLHFFVLRDTVEDGLAALRE